MPRSLAVSLSLARARVCVCVCVCDVYLVQIHECSEYRPSEQSRWSALFLLVLPSSSYLEPTPCISLSVRHSTSVSSFKSSLKTFLFLKAISSSIALIYDSGLEHP